MKKLKISQVSTFFANGSYPIEFLLFYPYKININKLSSALKKISSRFWPVFGTYANGFITENLYLESVYFDESSMDSLFDPSSVFESLFTNYGSITPDLKSHLFYLKVLHFTNGTILIPKMNHLVGDGYSYFFLLSILAMVTRRVRIPLLPSIITAIFQPKFQNKLAASFHFTATPPNAISYNEKLDVEFFEFKQLEIRNHAQRASETSGLRISTNDILSAKIVKLILENRKEKKIENFRLVIPIDVRRGVPELGQKFFGNGLILHNIPFQFEVVNQSTIEEIAITIRKSLPVLDRYSYEAFLKKVEGWIDVGRLDLLRPYDPNNECLVTNLTRMPITKLDFGLGPPTTIAPLTKGRSGAAILAQNDNFIIRLVR